MNIASQIKYIFVTLVLLLFSRTGFAEGLPSWSFHGSVGLGVLALSSSVQARWAGLIDLSFELDCRRGDFCQKYQVELLTSQLRLGLDADAHVSAHVPYFEASLRGIQWTLNPWLKVGAGLIELQRNPRFLDTTVNLTAQVGEVRFQKQREFRTGHWEWAVTIHALGGKYVGHETSSVPYAGLALAGVIPQFHLTVGKEWVKWDFGIRLGLQTSVGVSGDGTPDSAGSFGKLLFEPWADFRTRLQIRLKRAKESTLAWYLQGEFRYQALLDLGTQGRDMGFTAGLSSGILFL